MAEEVLKDILIKEGIVKIKRPDEEPYILKSGRKSRFFFDVKEATLNPKILHGIISTIIIDNKFEKVRSDKIASVAVGGVPIATGLSLFLMIPQIIVRSEKHKTGTQSKIIGNCENKNVILIEDVATSGGSLVNAVKDIREAGGICNDCIVVINRQEGAEQLCKDNDITLFSLLTKSDFGITE